MDMVTSEYLAGFMDGEGSLSLARRRRPGQSTEYSVRVVVYNSNREVLEEIKRTFGGTLSAVGTRDPKWRPAFALIWTNAAAVGLLTQVAPWLRIKSRHAAALIRFAEHIRQCERRRDSGGRLLSMSDEDVRIREAFHSQLKQLNRRGASSLSSVAPEAAEDRGGTKVVGVTAEYLAGLVDAEGSLMISKSVDAKSHRAQYGLRIAVSSTDKSVLEDVRDVYGGIVVDQPAGREGWRDAYQLVWSSGMSKRLLPVVGPHLRVKRAQAAVMKEFIEHQEAVKGTRDGRNSGRFPDEVLRIREGLRQRIMSLNARGPSRGRELEPVADDALLRVEPAEHHPDAHSDLHAGGLDVREHRGDPEPVV